MSSWGLHLSVCPSVRLSVCLSRSCILWKRINISSNFYFFSPSGSHTIIVFFHIKRCGNILTGPPNWGTNRDFRQMSGFDIDRCWTVACRQHFDGIGYSTYASSARDQVLARPIVHVCLSRHLLLCLKARL